MTGVNYYGRMRQGYIEAAAALREKPLPITDGNLGRELNKPSGTVREYLRRNTDVAASIGRELEKPMHGMTDYVNVISAMLKHQERIGYADVATALGIKRSAAFRFLRKRRRSIECAIPRATWIQEREGPRFHHYIAVKPAPMPAACAWPEGNPRDAEFHFCGADALPGKPYCADHSKDAYIQPKNDKNGSGK